MPKFFETFRETCVNPLLGEELECTVSRRSCHGSCDAQLQEALENVQYDPPPPLQIPPLAPDLGCCLSPDRQPRRTASSTGCRMKRWCVTSRRCAAFARWCRQLAATNAVASNT